MQYKNRILKLTSAKAQLLKLSVKISFEKQLMLNLKLQVKALHCTEWNQAQVCTGLYCCKMLLDKQEWTVSATAYFLKFRRSKQDKEKKINIQVYI